MFNLPPQVIDTLQKLQDNAYEAYVVGGCVRDFLLLKSPHDFDIASNAPPKEVAHIFADYPVIETGIQHGTVCVVVDNFPLEITSYRIDGVYLDNRRPDRVSFTQDIKADLARRDFTINAIAYHPNKGLVDPFGGQYDIQNKVIRAVGAPHVRFREDALRILRGIRFACTLGFTIDAATLQAMHMQKHLLNNISAPRVRVEFFKTLMGDHLHPVFMQCIDIWCVRIPQIAPMVGFAQNNPHHMYDVFTHALYTTQNTPPVLHLRLAAFFHDIGKPHTYTTDEQGIGHFYNHAEQGVSITRQILRDLHCDNATKDAVLLLIKYHDAQIIPTKKAIKRWLSRLGDALFFDLITLKKADTMAQTAHEQDRLSTLDLIANMARSVIAQGECFQIRDLEVDGNDLLSLGFRGKAIGDMLQDLLSLVMAEEIANEKEALLQYVKSAEDFSSEK